MPKIWPQNSKTRSRAFTLIEVVVAVALLGMVLATAGPTFRKSSVSTKGAALSLAAALTEARQQAITQQVPVALVIPSGNGSQGQADSYYIASGEQPRVTQVKWLGEEQPDLRLMVGHWLLDPAKLSDSALTTTVTPPPEATWENDFDVNQWGLAQPKDYAFIFTPRGNLVSNGLPHFDGAFHILVSQGGSSTQADAPGASGITNPPTLFSPSQVGSPFTVTISLQGAVSVSPGVVGAPNGASYVVAEANMAPSPDRAAIDSEATQKPLVTSLKMVPDPSKLKPASGADVLVAPGRHLTMTVRAQSPDKAPLFCEWKATDGGLSSPTETRMTFLPASQEWESVWQWRIPEGAVKGDQFTLEGTVKDKAGNETPVGLGAKADEPFLVEVGDPSMQVFFTSSRDGNTEIYGVNGDGTGLKRLTENSVNDSDPQISPDGRRIAFSQSGSNTEIYVMNTDGTGLTNLSNDPGSDYSPSWSPDGTRIAFGSSRSGKTQFHVMKADGTGVIQVTNTPGYPGALSWSHDGKRLLYVEQVSGKYQVFAVSADGSGPATQLTTSSAESSGPVYGAPDGRIYFMRYSQVHRMNADGSNPVSITSGGGYSLLRSLSTNGARIAFISYPGNNEAYVMNTDKSGLKNLSGHSASDSEPKLSGDASRVAFTSQRDGNAEVYVANTLTGDLVNVSNHPGYDSIGFSYHSVR